jgi:hypothetical protein
MLRFPSKLALDPSRVGDDGSRFPLFRSGNHRHRAAGNLLDCGEQVANGYAGASAHIVDHVLARLGGLQC